MGEWGWVLCLLPVTVIRCILELPGEIRSFPGSRCNGELPVVCLLTCAPCPGRGRGICQSSLEDEPAKPLCVLPSLTGFVYAVDCSGGILQGVCSCGTQMLSFLPM